MKEGYSKKGYTSYHGEPLCSTTKGGDKKAPQKAAPYKGSVTSDQGKPLGSATKGRG